MLLFGCVECWAAAVVCCGLTALEPLNGGSTAVISYRTVTQHLTLNSIRTLLVCICTLIKTGSRNFPNYFSYSVDNSTVVVLLHRFLSNQAHLKNLISTLSASSCCYCSHQRPVVGLADQPGYTNHVSVDGKQKIISNFSMK